jgi:hypothetical protein
MARFLYLTPYFPPQSRVGALRPLKFSRHLPAFGWEPVVVCDLWDGAKTSEALLAAVRDDTVVVRDYSVRAAAAEARFWADRGREPEVRQAPKVSWSDWIPGWLNNPELVPLGEHSPNMPHGYATGRRVLEEFACHAIVVNADPYAATLVGARLSRETGLPLVIDLRDPWAPCELRRPRRPAPIRSLVDRLERIAVEASAKVILNTETAHRDYLAHYPDLRADRFTFLRNHSDPELIGTGEHPGFDRFTLLFLGHFRRFVEGTSLLEALVELRRRGHTSSDVHMVVTGDCPASTWARARELGVEDMLTLHPYVPYTEVGAIMAAADLMVVLGHETRQRIPAKLYDYVVSGRPVLAVSENPEINRLLSELEGGSTVPFDAIGEMADRIEAAMEAGRRVTVPRAELGLTSREASRKLARLLDEVAR